MKYNILLERLPDRLAIRLQGLAGFVRTVLEEEQRNLASNQRLSHETLNDVQFVVVLIYLIEMLRESSGAATRAAAIFSGLGVSGFQVGSATFTKTSEESRLGREMAEELTGILWKINLPPEMSTAEGPGKLTRELFAWVQKLG
jgi:hypothetical protein